MNRTPMRPCGKPYATQEEALNSKRGRSGAFAPHDCRCGSWHLHRVRTEVRTVKPSASTASGPAQRKPPRDTGPDRKTRALVLARDGYQCARCGKPAGPGIGPYSLQHRKARGVGGDSSMPNLILLCGTATTGCHGHVEARIDVHDLAAGYRLESWQDPAAEGVMYASEAGSGFTAWLLDDGSLSFDGPGVAA